MIKKAGLTGLLLFGMFFGAGNLIFPPSLGALSGGQFWPAILGFVLSGVGIAVLTLIIGMLNPKGYVDEISQKISPWFATLYLVMLYLSIGPFFAIPRTATVAYEVGIAPMLSENTGAKELGLFTLCYFLAAYFIALNPSKILDSIGRILTPIFALLIVALVGLGIAKYGADLPQTASGDYAQNAFGTGFIEGYNTLDALASVAFSLVAIQTLKQLGFRSRKEYVSTIWLVGIVVALGFSVLYIGLAYLGNRFPVPMEVMNTDINKGVYILSQATQAIFGKSAQWFLAVMVAMTCFTTTAGLIVSTAEFFASRFPHFSYKHYAGLFTLMGLAVANLGLNAIIHFSLPVLLILYPITISIVMLVIVNKYVALSKIGMQLTIAFVTIVSLASVLGEQFQVLLLQQWINHLPFADLSLPWFIPSLVGLMLALVLPHRQKGNNE
ncbi:branched-chain amino acid transport system II carrier protein [Rodentibacter trehalosifermentans]|uniref:Branched-chain amino acid transport system carrier protein n=1 Tax=Rodentibacter trehalosifermentans TaxID=1908263 RepID=A0A1V3IYV8_9PAST|nr:branched-chain amino acid transport system II carrier protein [Rodentibacter trehalosifermentans]OOF46108.1 branched-chain amino acid transport system II carrier protein [Rodentibacter trehalosifermentans]OOF47415.1 branched-chain amino acid transport system II carrier protein [Rodentibacter trehalosifermentans]